MRINIIILMCAILIGGCTSNMPRSNESGTEHTAPFKVEFDGTPAIILTFDREYQAMELHSKYGPTMRAFMFLPKDQQSSAVLAIGDFFRKTDDAIAKMYEGAKVTKVSGVVRGKKVEWWHYHDSRHLYSTCYLTLPDQTGIERSLCFDLVANSQERLASLEKTFSEIELI